VLHTAPGGPKVVALEAQQAHELERVLEEHGLEERDTQIDVADVAEALDLREATSDTNVILVQRAEVGIIEPPRNRLVQRIERVGTGDCLYAQAPQFLRGAKAKPDAHDPAADHF